MSKQGRMTKNSKENLTLADKLGCTALDVGGFSVWVERDSRRAYVCSAQSVMEWPTKQAARNAIYRSRPDLADQIFTNCD